MLPKDPWYWIRSENPEPDGAWNMAMDAAMLELAQRFGLPMLRYYAWNEPAATFGYFQKYQEILSWTSLRPLYRRPTAGGLVPHDHDWTYSVAIPPGHPWYELRAPDSYEKLHRWIQQSFLSLGIEVTLVGDPITDGPGRCFIGAERHDLIWNGVKIAGAAQRRNRQGLLIQGSIQNQPEGVVRSDWESAGLTLGTRLWGADFTFISESTPELNELKKVAEKLYHERYSLDSFIQKR